MTTLDGVSIRFYAELNDFLSPAYRQVRFMPPIAERATVKHLIESLGVPHPEVDLVLVNDQPVGFSHVVQIGDRISVFPRFRRLDLGPWALSRQLAVTEPRFALDAHLGKLATYLRILGFDTYYRNDVDDETLAEVAAAEGRFLLTRDRALLMRRTVEAGMYVRDDDPERQAVEVIRRFGLLPLIVPFRRCLHCNRLLEPVSKQAIEHRLLPKTRRYHHEFRLCPGCDQVFWRGSHWEHMQALIDRLRQEAG